MGESGRWIHARAMQPRGEPQRPAQGARRGRGLLDHWIAAIGTDRVSKAPAK